MKSILVATDMSPRSDRAIERAAMLAKECDAQLHILSIIDSALPEEIAASLTDDIRGKLSRYATHLNGVYGITPVPHVVVGDLTTDLKAGCDAHEADLVVLGLHRPRPILEHFRETTMELLVRQAEIPVLLVKNAALGPIKKAVAAIDFSPASAGAVEAVHRLAPNAQISLISALHVPYAGMLGSERTNLEAAFRKEMEVIRDSWMEKYPLPEGLDPPVIVAGAVQMVVEAQVEALGADILAIGAHSRSLPTRWTIGSLAGDLVRRPPTDLLIAQPLA